MRPILLLTLITALAGTPAHAQDPGDDEDPSAILDATVEEYYEEFLVLNPVLATFNGDHRYNDRFTVTISPEHIEQSLALEQRYLEAIEAIDPELLEGQERLTWEVFRRGRVERIEGFELPEHLIPVNQFFSVPNFVALMGSGSSVQPFNTVQDYDNWLARVEGWPRWVDQAIANMREGAERGIVQPRPIMEKVIPQLEAHVVDDVEKSMFWTPVRSLPEEISEEDRDRLRRQYADVIRQHIVPAYARLRDFIRDEYMAHTRESVGLSALPGGKEWYAYLVRQRTSTNLSPHEIHELGVREVERIRAEMEQIREQLQFEGTLEELFDSLESVPELRFESEEHMLDTYRNLKVRVRNLAAALFSEYPEADFEVRRVETFRQASSAGASYMAASPDGSRPGVFYVNTRNWQTRTSQAAEALYLHEAVPGHHFQISIQRELDDLPRFRRFGGYTAYSEGWGLYAETIGKELGMYEDPYQHLGALASELFRAKRLVADTGLHAMGWSRERAIDYLNGNVAEAERYIVLPGQALAYKIGQLKIAELRARAEARLGRHFDVRQFHSAVLSDGALPLDVLEAKIERWITMQENEISAR